MNVEFDGKEYKITRGSVVTNNKDGVSVELSDTSNNRILIEIFHSDIDKTEIFFAEKIELPFELIRLLVKTADNWFKND